VTVLAASTSAFDQPGTLGFLVVFGMGIALFFVFRSMARHLRRLNTAARQDAAASSRPDAGAAASATQASAARDSTTRASVTREGGVTREGKNPG
jgi:hypothetical protein